MYQVEYKIVLDFKSKKQYEEFLDAHSIEATVEEECNDFDSEIKVDCGIVSRKTVKTI